MKKLLLSMLGLCLSMTLAHAQIEKGKFKDNKVIPAQPKDSTQKGTDSIRTRPLQFINPDQEPVAEPDKVDTDGMADGGFKMQKPPAIVGRDNLYDALGKKQLVRISEELYIDSVWVKAAEYYRIWDSNNINPYGKKASIFKDTIQMRLYNLPEGEYWASPLEKTLQTSSFGPRWGTFHTGVDLDLKMGTPVAATFDGIVRISTFENGYGNYVVLRHRNGLETLYGHFSKRAVEVGQIVKAGQIIGYGGSTGWSTGPHLHLETRYEGNTINPLLIYDFSKPQIIISEYFTLMPHHFEHLGNKMRQIPMHIVALGDTLPIISAKYNIPVDTLAKINNLTASSELKVGQKIRLK
ncbi:MAG: LysM peptidoglycan-binding domain-containing protein [Bacteroidetes bacterium]|nr:MAG: LysM peptidoglycan-binding domain-containing protein [Bacteroidota bacterium]